MSSGRVVRRCVWWRWKGCLVASTEKSTVCLRVCLLVMLVFLLGACGDGESAEEAGMNPVVSVATTVPATTTATSSAVPTSTTTVVEVPTGRLMDWQRVPSQESLGEGDAESQYLMHAVIAGGPGLIAGGQVRPASDLFDWAPVDGGKASVWVSADGMVWDRVPPDEAVFGGSGGALIQDLAVGGPGYVAVGSATERTDAAVWLSADGYEWSRVNSNSFEGVEMYAVAASDEMIVAVGDGAIWHSPDGVEWQRAEPAPGGFGIMLDVEHADWGFVAVGWKDGSAVACPNGARWPTRWPMAWISENGINWRMVELPPSNEEWSRSRVQSVAVLGNDVVVAGSYGTTCGTDFDMPPAFWTSNNGSDWFLHTVESSHIRGMTKPEARIYGLVIHDSGIVATGVWTHMSMGPHDKTKARAAVWVSTDNGTTWSEVPPGETFKNSTAYPAPGFEDAAVLGEKVIGVGNLSGDAAVWVGEWTD